MKNLKLLVLSSAIILSIGAYSTFASEWEILDSDYDTNDSDIDISDIDLSKVHSSKVILNINDKKFTTTSKYIEKYPVLGYFSFGNTEIPDVGVISDELIRDLEVIQKSSDDSNDSNLRDIFNEIKYYIVEESGITRPSPLEHVSDQYIAKPFYNYKEGIPTLTINGKDFSLLKRFVINKYPILKKFMHEQNPFIEGTYTFEDCKNLTNELKENIEIFQNEEESEYTDKIKKIFMEIRSAIEQAIRKLANDPQINTTERYEMNIYIRDDLTQIIQDINYAEDKILSRKLWDQKLPEDKR